MTPVKTADRPRVSIGLPVYNGENFLEFALDSILGQTFQDFELIISDNASTDATESICRRYAAKDSRIRYYRNPNNQGAAQNYNRVFALARGEYFKWAAHDDVCKPNYLKQCVEVLDRESEVVLCYPKAHSIDGSGKQTGTYTKNLNIRHSKPNERLHQLLKTYGWYHATQAFGLMRAHVLQQTLLIGNYPHADRVLLAELALHGKFYEVPEFLFERRVHPKISTHANKTDETLSAWYGKGVFLPRWRRYFEYCRAVYRTDITKEEQLRSYLQIIRRLLLSPGVKTRVKGMLREILKSPKIFLGCKKSLQQS